MTARRKHNFTLPEIERLVDELVAKDYNILSLKGRLYSLVSNDGVTGTFVSFGTSLFAINEIKNMHRLIF